MFKPNQASVTGYDLRNEHPFLFPWNRRLRNLHGISLRNLNTSSSISRAHGKTITDDDVPYNLASPAKLLVQSEDKGLGHSRSLTDLSTSLDGIPHQLQKASTLDARDEKVQSKTGRGRLRRRSTLHWSTSHPRLRQTKLEAVTLTHLADTWFSIHSKHIPEPVYISEIMEKSMNPSFAFFDLDTKESKITRDQDFTIRVWAKDNGMEEYNLLIELNLNMRSLQYIGRTLEAFHHPLPQNCILLHLSDGIYTSFTDLPPEHEGPWTGLRDSRNINQAISSSFDALMQLGNLDECIQDALRTKAELEADINSIIASRHILCEQRKGLIKQQEQGNALKAAITTEQKQKSQVIKRKEDLEKSLRTRRREIMDGRNGYEKTRRQAVHLKKSSGAITENSVLDVERSHGQLRRIAETMLRVFPIEPVKSKTLQFSIRNIYLPNSTYDDTNRDEIAAALGFTSQLVHQLSFYLSVPLPYPLEPNSSDSLIRDPISVSLVQRTFPLHPTTVGYKFEYGVFLLNKDIEFLMNKSGLRVLDIRHTLPNLKYLLYILTAGTGDLPTRKAGGFRGLIGDRLTPTVSRRSSEDSVLDQGDYGHRGFPHRLSNDSAFPKNAPKEKDSDHVHALHSSRKPAVDFLPQSVLRDVI